MALALRNSNFESSAKAHVAPSADAEPRPLLEGLRLDYGPVSRIAEFLLKADKAMADRVVTICISSLSELVRVNSINRDTWGTFTPILDVRVAPLTAENSYCLTGLDRAGEVVVLQGGRLIDTGDITLQQMADDQSIYYGRAHNPSDAEPRCLMSVPKANHLRGRLTYSGGLWVNPIYRGVGFSALMPRISRLLALGRWDTNHTISFVTDSLAGSPVLKAYGYKNIEPRYSIQQNGVQTYSGSLVWMDTAAVIEDMESFLSTGFTEIDRAISERSSKQVAASA
ncbi:MAG: hypothetical protein ABL994_18470 [Verrucomicrobiales bacterium]